MKAIRVTTDNVISIVDICLDDWRAIRDQVDGWFEHVYTAYMQDVFTSFGVDDKVVMLCDEQGLVKGKPVNLLGSFMYCTPQHGHPIVGDILFTCQFYDTLTGFKDADEVVRQLRDAYPFLRKEKL